MGRIITFSNALKEALSEEMARDERVYLIGQDLKYNVWGVTNGLNQKFGVKVELVHREQNIERTFEATV